MADEQALLSTAGGGPGRRSRIFGQYVIKTRFQFKFAATIFVFLASATLIIWLWGRVAVYQLLESGAITDAGAVEQLQILMRTIGMLGILAVAIVFGLSLFFSHFVAGPIYRFERTLEEMRSGNIAMTVRVRRHDEFKETAEQFNQALAGLRAKVRMEREQLHAALSAIGTIADGLRTAGRSSEPDAVEKAIADCRALPPHIKI